MNPSFFDQGMHTASESNREEDKAELQQTGMQRNLYGDSLTSYGNGSIISQIPQKNIQHMWAVRDDLSYLPAAAVSSYTIADPCQEERSSNRPKGSMAEPLFPTSRPSTIASLETNRPLNEYHRAKRVRVENIIQNMSESPNVRFPGVGERSDAGTRDNGEMLRGSKRKWRLPQSGGGCGGKEDCGKLREQLRAMQRLLGEIQQRLLQVYWPGSSEAENREEGTAGSLEWDNSKKDRKPPKGSECKLHVHQDSEVERRLGGVKMDGWQAPQVDGIHLTFNQGHKNLPEALKCELTRAVSSSVDLVFRKLSPTLYYQSPEAHVKPNTVPSYMKPGNKTLLSSAQEPSLDKDEIKSMPLEFNEKSKVPMTKGQTEALSLVIRSPFRSRHCSVEQMEKKPCHSHQGPLRLNRQSSLRENQILEHLLKHAPHGNFTRLPCLTQVMDKVSQESVTWDSIKVRPKVNSNHMNHEAHATTLGQGSLCHPRVLMESRDLQAVAERNFYKTLDEGLTPNHLKKAKLIFFYCRYPNSNVLKTFFPDIKFNRCITSQLIKWFSNFREFYYIQMEKSARQSIMDRVDDVKDLSVTRDSELFRALSAHFDKANDFQVPDRFLEVAEITLREFFNAILLGKDFDPSWKKVIYKVICKLDSEVPEVFKSTVYL